MVTWEYHGGPLLERSCEIVQQVDLEPLYAYDTPSISAALGWPRYSFLFRSTFVDQPDLRDSPMVLDVQATAEAVDRCEIEHEPR